MYQLDWNDGVTKKQIKIYSLRPIEDDSLSFLVSLLKMETLLSLLYSLSLTLLSPLNTQNKFA